MCTGMQKLAEGRAGRNDDDAVKWTSGSSPRPKHGATSKEEGSRIRKCEGGMEKSAATDCKSGWRVTGARWIDINESDDERPNNRGRLAGKKLK